MEARTESLIKWLQTFPIEAPNQNVQQLTDGVAMARALHQIDPLFFDQNWMAKIKADVGQNWRLKVSNLKKILKGTLDYYSEMLDQTIPSTFPMPDVGAVGEHADATETGRLLQLVLACAINCPGKQGYIETIMGMEESVQHVVMKAIQEVIPERAASGDTFSEHSDHIKVLEETVLAKEQLAQRCRELELQLSVLQEEKATLQHENERLLQQKSSHMGEGPSITNNRRHLQLQHKVEMLQDECYKMETSRDEYKLKCEQLQKELVDVQSKNEELQKLADEARLAKDELDVLRHTSDKVAQYETIIESYKKKLEESGDLKRQIKLLEEQNMDYVQQNMELEEEMKRAGALRSQVDLYKKQTQELHAKSAEETRRADRAEFEIARLTEKLTSAQQDKDRLMMERDVLKETIEELKCDQLQNEHGNKGMGSDPELMGMLPPAVREKLIRLEHENKLLRIKQDAGGEEKLVVLQSLLDDSQGRRTELETQNRLANQRILELEGQLADLKVGQSQQSNHSPLAAELQKAKAHIESLESQLQASVEKCYQQQNLLSKKDEAMTAMEERYRKYLEKAKNVIGTLNTKNHSGMGPEIVALRNQLAEKDKIIESLESEVEKTRTLTETEERLITTAFFNLGSHLQRKAAEERLTTLPSVPGQTFLARQRQAASRRFNLPEMATSDIYEK